MTKRARPWPKEHKISKRPWVDVDMFNPVYGPSCTWEEWKSLYGGGLIENIRYIASGAAITREQYLQLQHTKLVAAMSCHKYNRVNYCFCEIRDELCI